jgi:hypothetical protein
MVERMKARLLVPVALLMPALVVATLEGCEEDSASGSRDASFDSTLALPDSDSPRDAQLPSDAADAPFDADACVPGPEATFLDGGGIVPTPYLRASDSPFHCRSFSRYYHLETFEQDEAGAITQPGLKALTGAPTRSSFTAASIDSVDEDDGMLSDGGVQGCVGCNSWIHTGATGVTFEFDETVLGELPTHTGLVFTDGNENVAVTFEAFGADGGTLVRYTVPGLGDSSQLGTTGEDRFFGTIQPIGIKRIKLSTNGVGGIEADHVQYGR